MNPLHLLAYHHYGYGGGWTDWMAHVLDLQERPTMIMSELDA